MVLGEEGVEIFISEQVMLLDDLRVDVGGAQGFDLSN